MGNTTPYHCRDCGYQIRPEDMPTARCPVCGSIHLLNTDTKVAPEANQERRRIEARWDAGFKIASYVFVTGVVSFVAYLLIYKDEAADHRLLRILVRLMEIFAR